ncbi:hypothetical protein CTI12_AA364330 [Artemisia annua]|uniref:Uncharacterized protein n=1 Tax=Artemisia annua TaxID=35608 RepID=A0A2U1L967_ARTAN|nr:hypothetical protein CTI12_AA364330 [Artemisia annua]
MHGMSTSLLSTVSDSRLKSKGSGKRRSGEDAEVKEIWETVAGGDSERFRRSGSEEEKISAATVLCGASLTRGWNIQEHTGFFIIKLLSPPVPVDYCGNESHLIVYAPLLNVLLIGISSLDCVQIFSLHGLMAEKACVKRLQKEYRALWVLAGDLASVVEVVVLVALPRQAPASLKTLSSTLSKF